MAIAEINVARLAYDIGDRRVAPFVNNLDRVNAIAERSPGFIWRYTDDSGNAIDTQVADDPRVIVNLSVWERVADLENFVWNTVHRQFYARRDKWFEAMKSMHFAMWHVEESHQPSVEEALARLHHLNAHGPSDHAFGWESVPEARLWRTARCSHSAA